VNIRCEPQTRFRHIAEAWMMLCLGVSTEAAAPGTSVPDLNRPGGTSHDGRGSGVYWLMISPAKPGTWQVSLEFSAPGQGSWMIEAEPWPNLARTRVQEIVADRVQVGFELGPLKTEPRRLMITLSPRQNRHGTERGLAKGAWQVPVPMERETETGVATTALIPELRDYDGECTDRPWYAWDVVVQREGAAVLSVRDAHGQSVRSFPVGYLPRGATEILWDGLDDSGKRRGAGPYFLQGDSADILPRIVALPGRSMS
jgi:flagellar hook capping protein FlgD